MKTIRTLEEMPGALSYLIEKVESLEKTAQSLLNRQKECCSPHWMDVDELCDYIPSHPVKQTVYGWVSDRQIPHHKINKALVFLQSEIDDWMKQCGRTSTENRIKDSQKA
jgi:nitrate/TMAO reductase-like tetraheme cytochrome c subunit